MKLLLDMVGVTLLTVLVDGMAVPQCACASDSTPVDSEYGSDDGSVGVLQAGGCAEYTGDDQQTVEDGRIFAQVHYNGQTGWVLTATVYLMPCSAFFDCVCAKEATSIKTSPESNGLSSWSLDYGQCVNIDGCQLGKAPISWVPVKLDGQNGWIKRSRVSFDIDCFAPPSDDSSVQLPGCPTIITRAGWGAREAKPGVGTLTRTPYYALIHHGSTDSCHTKQECIRLVQSYQHYHMDGRGWSDIGYSFVVGEDGNVYEGRGWNSAGAHTYGYNSIGLGFCVMGNFTTRLPDQAARDALQQLIACGVSNNKLTSTYTLLGHRDTNPATPCPGNMFWEEIKQWSHYNSTVIPSQTDA